MALRDENSTTSAIEMKELAHLQIVSKVVNRKPSELWRDLLSWQLAALRESLPYSLAGTIQFRIHNEESTNSFFLLLNGIKSQILEGESDEVSICCVVEASEEQVAKILFSKEEALRQLKIFKNVYLFIQFLELASYNLNPGIVKYV